jgi:23S rRNA pseudouridine955/2504/2580 synthase
LCHIHGIIDPKNGVLRDYLTKDEKKNKVLISKKPLNQGSSEIITEYKTLSHENNISLLEIHLITGKTHQIRAHMAFIGHPLVGESKYTDIRVKNGSHQDLISYKVTFNFKTNDGELGYLNHKTFALKPNSL